jgi:uncharacterized protein YbjT (DUF2867 family)
MKVILFGATGMVGQGLLRECLLDPTIEHVLSIVRTPTGQKHAKLTELVHKDFLDYSSIESQLTGYDTCFYCLGVTSSGMSAGDYSRVTYDMTMAAAQTLARLNPATTFIFVSGTGTDSTEKGPTMWARVKGKTENALLRLPFKAAYMFRPAGIQPLHGIKSRTAGYRITYALAEPIFPLLKLLLPNYITTTEHLGRAMIRVAQCGFPKRILEARDINQVSAV